MTKNLNSANFPWFASRNLWCTDAAKWALHLRSTRRHASYVATRASVLGLILFFLFLRIPVDLAPIRTDLALIRTKPGRFGQNWVVSAESEHIGWWPKLTETAETDQNGRNRPWIMHCTSKKLKSKPYRWVETHEPKPYLGWNPQLNSEI